MRGNFKISELLRRYNSMTEYLQTYYHPLDLKIFNKYLKSIVNWNIGSVFNIIALFYFKKVSLKIIIKDVTIERNAIIYNSKINPKKDSTTVNE